MSYGDLLVTISRYEHLDYDYGQWVCHADWDNSSSDPIIYLRDAKYTAKHMIELGLEERLNRSI